jgi:hypothetical protein
MSDFTTKPLLTVPANVGTDHLNGDLYLHPDIAAFKNDPVIANLASAHKGYREGFGNVVAAMKVRDPSVTEAKQFLDVAKRAQTWLASAADRGTSASTAAKHEIERIDRTIVETLGIVEGTYSAELRAHFKSLKPNDRVPAAMAAIKAKDATTLAAILAAPAALSGITVEQQKVIRDEYERIHAGDLLKRRRAIEKALAVNLRTFDDALSEIDRLFPRKTVAEITARTNEARAAKELI